MELTPIVEGEIGSVASVVFRADASARSVATKPQLTLQVSGPKQVMIGGDVTLSIKLANPGTGSASGVVLSEKVPTALRHPAGGEVEFEVGTLKPGETRQIDLTLSAAQAGHVTNLLIAHGDAQLRAEQRVDLEVIAPGLQVAMAGPTRRYLERQATYTMSVSNPGTAPARRRTDYAVAEGNAIREGQQRGPLRSQYAAPFLGACRNCRRRKPEMLRSWRFPRRRANRN